MRRGSGRLKLRGARTLRTIRDVMARSSALRTPHSPFPRAFSLFEILIALAIFAMSAAVIGQLISSGSRGAVRAQLESEAVLRCESKLGEIVAGATSLQTTSQVPFTDDSAWTWSCSIAAGPHQDLYLVQVTVSHPSSGQLSDHSYTLSRLVRDPNVTKQMLTDQQAKQQTSQSSSSSSSSTGSSSSSGGSR